MIRVATCTPVLAGALALSMAVPALPAQLAEGEPAGFTSAVARLARGDTLGAISDLRDAARVAPRFGPTFVRLGALLAARAGEGPADLQLRLQARAALERAAELLGNEPEVLLEYGLLLRKQQMRVDALRVLERAERAADRRAAQLSPAQAARLHYALGRMYETWWEDWEDLVRLSPAGPTALRCSRVPDPYEGSSLETAFAQAAPVCPREWNIVADAALPTAELKSEEHALMVAHFRLALRADSGYVDAAVRLLGHLANEEAWEEYDAVVRRLARAAPDDARVHLFRGLGLHERGLEAAADSAFQRTLALLRPEERRVFRSIGPVLPPAALTRYAALDSGARTEVERAFFTSHDPLLLTDVEERRLEHYARVAWAELKYSDPTGGPRGWDSDRGHIWIRYGRPWRTLQCCFGGGRNVFWAYSREGPVFVFSRHLTYRYARLTEDAQQLADEAAALTPERYRPPFITSISAITYQLVRLRGARTGETRVEIYAGIPVDLLPSQPPDSLDAGIFVFDRTFRPLWSRRHGVSATAGAVDYRFDVRPGVYSYTLEARPTGPEAVPRPLARARDSVVVSASSPDRLGISDLLLADSLAALVPVVTRRTELRVWPSRSLEFPRGAAVHIYFEVYGLAADPDSIGRYRVQLAVEDAGRRNVLERVTRGIQELFRRTRGATTIEWQREVRAVGDRTVDYLSLGVPPLPAGPYTIQLRVTDEASGETAAASRLFRVR